MAHERDTSDNRATIAGIGIARSDVQGIIDAEDAPAVLNHRLQKGL